MGSLVKVKCKEIDLYLDIIVLSSSKAYLSNGQRISSAFWDRDFGGKQDIFWRDSSAIAEKNNAV